jgi:AraC-like DNA-binding protein
MPTMRDEPPASGQWSTGALRAAGVDNVREYMCIGQGTRGIERMEARFVGQAFSLHRHDSFAIGVTLEGVQQFRYRGSQRWCLPGDCHVLHPDEPHDGASGSTAPFAYRIAYIDPTLVQQALGGAPLPFVADPVVRLNASQWERLSPVWREVEDGLEEMKSIEIGTAVADLLLEASGRTTPPTVTLPLEALLRTRALLAAAPATPHSAAALERVAGLDRWTLARQFRLAFGTSPTRFRTMRQLDRVRLAIRQGRSLVDASHDSGFCDQSHMSRMFKRAYGMSPARWAARIAARP